MEKKPHHGLHVVGVVVEGSATFGNGLLGGEEKNHSLKRAPSAAAGGEAETLS